MNQYISTIDTIVQDPSFDALFNVSYQGDLASFMTASTSYRVGILSNQEFTLLITISM